MQSFNIFNILNQALNPSRFKVMFDKVLKRLFSGEQSLDKKENLKWIKANISDLSDFGKKISQTFWAESLKESKVPIYNSFSKPASILARPLVIFLVTKVSPRLGEA